MMSAKNRFGLSRYIPKEVKKSIRRRCGFGCVICGNAIITYEHMHPRFRDAKQHDPNRMTLLCGSHQLESSKGTLSLETISYHDRNPKSKERGFSNHVFDLSGKLPGIALGTVLLAGDQRYGLSIAGRWWLKVDPPEKKSRLWRLSAFFHDDAGNEICHIDSSELRFLKNNYDIEQLGRRFIIVDEGGKTQAEFEVEPPSRLTVRHMNTIFRHNWIKARPDGLYLPGYRKLGGGINLLNMNIYIGENGDVLLDE